MREVPESRGEDRRGSRDVWLRSKVTKGPGSRAAGLAMAFARARWHAVNAPQLVALVRAGAVFEKRRPVETAR